MTFIVFELSGLYVQQRDESTRVEVRFVEAESMERAKELMRTCSNGAWAIIPKETFDRGIVQRFEHGREGVGV